MQKNKAILDGLIFFYDFFIYFNELLNIDLIP